jgi:Terpene cyclase DEP1
MHLIQRRYSIGLWLGLMGLAILTVLAVYHHGLVGIFQYQLANFAGMQVLFDLVIALGFFLVWMWHDARSRGVSPWPWVCITLVAGSFGPLLYFIVRQYQHKKPL